mmetsp:Transcript_107671/g.300835  ORF Transcript_107671/g.300835 Transcript_107671/m.300835 type:complete len:219 (-) Transcript_107671:1878-2534(-)
MHAGDLPGLAPRRGLGLHRGLRRPGRAAVRAPQVLRSGAGKGGGGLLRAGPGRPRTLGSSAGEARGGPGGPGGGGWPPRGRGPGAGPRRRRRRPGGQASRSLRAGAREVRQGAAGGQRQAQVVLASREAFAQLRAAGTEAALSVLQAAPRNCGEAELAEEPDQAGAAVLQGCRARGPVRSVPPGVQEEVWHRRRPGQVRQNQSGARVRGVVRCCPALP